MAENKTSKTTIKKSTNPKLTFHILTIFPNIISAYTGESILARAIKNKLVNVKTYDIRDYVTGKYRKIWPDGNVSKTVDDRPFGGGPGMVMMAEPIIKCLDKIIKKHLEVQPPSKIKIIHLVPSAKKFDTKYAKDLVNKNFTDVIIICGRYEGIDARVMKIFKGDHLSVGDYVLTGGELPALVMIDCISRQVEGVLGNFDSREEERVSASEVYTRPEVIKYTPPSQKEALARQVRTYKVPPVLLGGNHAEIENWKKSLK